MLVNESENAVYERARLALARKQKVAEAPAPEERPLPQVATGAAPAAAGMEGPLLRPLPRQTAEPADTVAENPPEQGRTRWKRPLQLLVLAMAGCVVGWLLAWWLAGPRDAKRAAAVQTAPLPTQATMSAVAGREQSKPSPEVPAAGPGAVGLKPEGAVAERGQTVRSPAPAVSNQPAAAGQAAARTEADGANVQDVVDRWRAALLSNNAERIAPMYASTVERYFLRTGVNRAYVRQYMQRQEAKGTRLTAYEFGDETMHRLPDGSVEVRFVANFRVSTPTADLSGRARTQLKLRQEDGQWRIFSERDFSS